jgi:cyclic pyranopterin phosphate synthase
MSLIDPFQRRVDYLRLSVTDRCNYRCVYCMTEDMQFLPRADLLSLEELDRLASAFIDLGVRKLRITGGEPLVRRDVMKLFRSLGRHLRSGGLAELTTTTNGLLLDRHAHGLADAGVRRVNVSLDTLDPERFRIVSRGGDLADVMRGLDAAVDAGLRVRINTVAMRGVNQTEMDRLVGWCGDRGFDLALIEVMPMGETELVRAEHFLSLDQVCARLERSWTLEPTDYATAGPARYQTVRETGARIGFITPHSRHFCATCNRVRLTCTGALYLCLGQDHSTDLRQVLRDGADDTALRRAIREAVAEKPQGHAFDPAGLSEAGRVVRFMSLTGG